METFLTSPNLDEVVPVCSNVTEIVKIYPNVSDFIQIWKKFLYLTQTFLNVLKFQLSHSIHPSFEQDCLKLLTIEWSCCKLPKFDLTEGLHSNVSHLSKHFYFHPNVIEAFIICPDLIEAVGPYRNAPNLLKCFKFYPKLDWRFLVGPNLMKAVGITTWFQFTQG